MTHLPMLAIQSRPDRAMTGMGTISGDGFDVSCVKMLPSASFLLLGCLSRRQTSSKISTLLEFRGQVIKDKHFPFRNFLNALEYLYCLHSPIHKNKHRLNQASFPPFAFASHVASEIVGFLRQHLVTLSAVMNSPFPSHGHRTFSAGNVALRALTRGLLGWASGPWAWTLWLAPSPSK